MAEKVYTLECYYDSWPMDTSAADWHTEVMAAVERYRETDAEDARGIAYGLAVEAWEHYARAELSEFFISNGLV